VALSKSSIPSRIETNFQDFELHRDAVGKINSLDRKARYNSLLCFTCKKFIGILFAKQDRDQFTNWAYRRFVVVDTGMLGLGNSFHFIA
jgi:hypothetical protein